MQNDLNIVGLEGYPGTGPAGPSGHGRTAVKGQLRP